jgi:hypothetical protein
MKRLKLIALFILLTGFTSLSGQGTTTLRVYSMPGFPALPADTALEGQLYSFSVELVNNTFMSINSSIEVNMRVDSLQSILGVVLQPAVGPNDSVSMPVNGYGFTQPQFKAGNNIVVVWPRVIGTSFPIDTFYTNVYFVPLSSSGGDPVASGEGWIIGPNPVQDELQWISTGNMEVEHVRIFSTTGELVQAARVNSKRRVNISDLSPGLYFFEFTSGKYRSFGKFVKH